MSLEKVQQKYKKKFHDTFLILSMHVRYIVTFLIIGVLCFPLLYLKIANNSHPTGKKKDYVFCYLLCQVLGICVCIECMHKDK